MKRSYDMIDAEEEQEQEIKVLNLSGKNQIHIPMNFHEMYPHLESLDLSNNQLQEACYGALENLIDQSTTLKVLDISNNPLPSHCIIALHDFADSKIKLVSDLSSWIEAHPNDVFPKITWALSPEQWARESHYRQVFETIAEYWVDTPENRPQFIAALTPILHQKNLLGWTPLICAVLISSPKLANALIDRLGIENFTQALIAHCQDRSATEFLPETWLPGVVHHCYLMHARNPDLAFRLVQTLLPENCGARFEVLGNIALAEEKYAEAYEHHSAGASLGWTACDYIVAMMISNQCAPELLPFNPREVTRHLQIAADAGHICAQLDLGKAFEDARKLPEAYFYYEKAREIINESPNLLHGLALEMRHLYTQRIRLLVDLTNLINAIMNARVELAHQRAQQLVPAFNHFNKQVVYEKLCEKFGDHTMQKIIKTLGHSLLQHYIFNEKIVDELSEQACILARRNPLPNQELLSHDPEIFALSLMNFLEHELARRAGSTMRTGTTVILQK
jgi:hypothetical protein